MKHWLRVLVVAALPLLSAAPAMAGAHDAREWITRMNSALATRNYDGVFAHKVGDYREVMRILHRTRDGKMMERLVSTDGSGREFVRNGTEWVAYLPDRKIALVEIRNRSWGFMVALNGLTKETERFYALSVAGTERLLGRSAQLIKVEPRDGLRYGYRFWLDQETALPLKTQLVSRSGEVLEEIKFVSLDMQAEISDEEFKPDVDVKSFRRMQRTATTHSPDVKARFSARGDLMPAGFRVRIFNSAEEEAKAKGPRTRFIVSDGVAWVSVFVEVDADKGPQPPPAPGWCPHGPRRRPPAKRRLRNR